MLLVPVKPSAHRHISHLPFLSHILLLLPPRLLRSSVCLCLLLLPPAGSTCLFPACSLLNAYCSLQTSTSNLGRWGRDLPFNLLISAPRFAVCSVCLSLTTASGALWLCVACGPFADPLTRWTACGLAPACLGLLVVLVACWALLAGCCCWLLTAPGSGSRECSGSCCPLPAPALDRVCGGGHGSPPLVPLSLSRLPSSAFFVLCSFQLHPSLSLIFVCRKNNV